MSKEVFLLHTRRHISEQYKLSSKTRFSSRIYENLPEVQRRREEERRRAEYRSYRLNAQLYNKVQTFLIEAQTSFVDEKVTLFTH